MKRTVRPAEEEMGRSVPVFLFSFLWMLILSVNLIAGGASITLLLFMAVGLLPLFTAVNIVRRALFYRRQRAEAIAAGDVKTGKIRGVSRKAVPYYTGRHNNILRYRRYYCLQVEITDPVTGAVSTIESQDYSKPVYRWLAGDRVRVYVDRSGWKYFLEDFQWKEKKSDPGIFDDRPFDFEETMSGNGSIIQIIFLVLFVLIVLSSFLEGRGLR